MANEALRSTRRPSLHDVAERAGVAVSTVSRFLNGQLELRPETESRVMQAIEEVGYSRTSGSSRASSSKGVIGLVVPRIGNAYFGGIAENVVRSADSFGLAVLIASTFNQVRRQSDYVELFAAKELAGIVYAGSTTSNAALARLIGSGMPVVVIDEALVDAPPVDTVVVDDYAGAYQATAHLAALGHERIALVTGPESLASVRERRRGFVDACVRAGLDPEAQFSLAGDFSEEFGIGALSHLLAAPQRPTAVFAASDAIALGMMAGARNLGIGIPGDLSIVGFDDVPGASHVSPRLTTIRTPLDRMASSALSMLSARIDDPDAPVRRSVTPVVLVVGESSAPPSA
ncbi:LacI family DNA-binding transcriptional regulator [Demequina sp. SYSU T00039]|uniref:LacI family DNA-binding transcriptional regulator n=1 Tax=Demequina lignilytica TaxID=3051663 RepID=A0AAW7M106_9MICO|nr:MULTISPECIES: LacI family DNA-binding transcriptional regulator [unclassified Demequina]MDN4477650.1 LacI family DNA-binding transcriptional regulator [Demequina sp. SYSU T00039-1]MDN4487999.1 LacI family DNA-binding transcriptional regulator [Demequina sp. SYSU T00039]